jgi:transcription-repair coupling factor (superfamily II helicase)
MAMTGIRDMSLIEEAPQDRHPVQTYVIERNMGVVAQALAKELKRGGQAYFVHNRIETIAEVTAELKDLLPNARIAFAHGQMSHEQISEIWERLTDGEIDVLVSTTIIETGIDVPNVNTIIIDYADHFGLSQLYQLKGRVGRSTRRAYAYMMFKNDGTISVDAQKRLDAIKEFTQFGSGFKIAMRDLEIRGAGNILGGSQHGHMEAVGYELYVKLLSQAISHERGEVPIKRVEDCIMNLQLDSYIPDRYITSVTQRLDVYKRIVTISTEEEKSDMVDELIDRYGEPPKAVSNLVEVSYFRNLASNLGIYNVTLDDGWITFNSNYLTDADVKALSKSFKGKMCSNLTTDKSFITIEVPSNMEVLTLVEKVLKTLK